MAILNALNALIDWMNGFGLNDYSSITILMAGSSVAYVKVVEAWKKRKEKRAVQL